MKLPFVSVGYERNLLTQRLAGYNALYFIIFYDFWRKMQILRGNAGTIRVSAECAKSRFYQIFLPYETNFRIGLTSTANDN